MGTINVIFAALGRTSSHPSRVMSVARLFTEDSNSESKRARVEIRPVLSFSNEDKIGTIQPHDDALVVTLRIGRYDLKRVLVDQGNGAEIMYPNLNNGLSLEPGDSTTRGSGGGLHYSGCLFPLHRHYGKALAPCLGSRFIHLAFES